MLLPVFILLAAFHKKDLVTISGNITDETGATVSNVSVTAGSAGTISYGNGKYTIAVRAREIDLVYSAVDRKQEKVKIKRRNKSN